MSLTAAGAALLEDGREILAAVDGALERARALTRGQAGSLVIGSLGPAPGELGHRPNVSPYVGDKLEEWLHLIGRGEGIDTCPAIIARYYAWPEVAFVPLTDAAPATLVLAYSRDRAQPLIDEVVALALELADAPRPLSPAVGDDPGSDGPATAAAG